ncbi:hypothetical protein [Sphingomonas sp. G-3-2-10]|uniref:hypothetical protein n=1 Tax=Sphingomonas sp. G-3-2-10 TaxID=2728838 RepID=UPI00146ABBA4|nr:hypothetical protein [Sphingomonas sp. G-3-2-10]NML06550.1 hypothetical protein [Sphingomonas sp. G-3-2-10]
MANMNRELRGPKADGGTFTGTRMFSAGTRPYVGEIYEGMGEAGHVIGMHRASKELVNCVVRLLLLDDVRVSLEYSPGRINALRRLKAQIFSDREAAEALARYVKGWVYRNLSDRERKRIDRIDEQASN